MIFRHLHEIMGRVTLSNVVEFLEFEHIRLYNIPPHLEVDQKEKLVVLLVHDEVDVLFHFGQLFVSRPIF